MKKNESISRAAAVDEVAADWLLRQGRGLNSREQVEFDRWLDKPEHAAAFGELTATWESLDQLSDVKLPNGRALDHDLPSRPAQPHGRRWKVIAWAAAAIVVVSFGMRGSLRNAGSTTMAATPVGGFQKMELPDGSIVRLNTDTEISYGFSSSERRVSFVRGEAHFEVAKDATRPFVVTVGQVMVRAVGTAFNVRLKDHSLEVMVTEGKVSVNNIQGGHSLLPGAPEIGSTVSGDDPVLAAGQRALVALAPEAEEAPAQITPVAEVEIARVLAWQDKRLDFNSTPLAVAVEEFNRYNRRKLVIVDEALREKRFGGSFAADNSDAFVRLLEARFGVRAERTEERTLLRIDR